jgi:PST family polysaccharide transporter
VSEREQPNTPSDGVGAGQEADDASGSLATRAVRGTAWVAGAQLSGKFLFFLSTIILARVLDKEDFGVAAYAVTLIALMSAIPALGIGPALIVHAEDEDALSSGFWLAMASACAAVGVIWVAAPLTEHIFHDARAIGVTRALALTFPIQALRVVHATTLRKQLAFDRRFVPELTQSLTKGLASIALALLGWGYWSLIYGTLAGAAASAAAYWIVTGWRPRLVFHSAVAKRLLGYGAHVVGIDMMGALIRNADNLLVGRLLGSIALGVYVLAFRIPDLLVRNLCQMLSQVMLPVYAKVRSDPAAIRRTFVATLGYVFAITAPMAIGLAIVSEPLVLTLFSAKWAAVVPVIPPICMYALLGSLSYNVGDLFKAVGRPDLLTRIGVFRVVTVVPALWYAASAVGTPAAVAWAQASTEVLALAVNLAVAQRVFQLPVFAALSQTLPVLAAATAMAAGAVGMLLVSAGWPEPVRLVLATGVGGVVYVLALRMCARGFFERGIDTLSSAMGRRRVVQGGV